jgi:hypothetical protein
MLTFMGHWPRVVIPLPGDAYLAVPFTGSPGHDGHHHSHGSPEGDAAEHERHCHAAAATCSNFQTSASAPVAVVRDTLAFLGANAPLLPAAVAGEGVYLPPALARWPSPEPSPERSTRQSVNRPAVA